MLLLFVMGGSPWISHQNVHVAKISLLNMPSRILEGFPTLRHNEISDLTASLLMEVCSNVVTQPELQQLNGEVLRGNTANKENEAHLDIAADGFWGPGRARNYLDFWVFNPFAPANRKSSLAFVCHKHENEKKN